MEIFYYPDIQNDIIYIPAEESKHIIKVLRKKIGDTIAITDGRGNLYQTEIISIDKTCSAAIKSVEKKSRSHNYYFHLAFAPTKANEKIELIVEKCVEIGVDEISPIISEHSERKVVKTERLKNVAIAAMKQSGNIYLPIINEPTTFNKFIDKKFNGNLCIAHCNNFGTPYYYDAIKEGYNLILIGPEGDFSQKEVDTAINHGYKAVQLGNSILRVETAAIFCCSAAALKLYKRNKE